MNNECRIKKLGWGFGRCNQFCDHCYNSSKRHAPEYTFNQLKTVADKVCVHIDDINYGTGEFFMNPNSTDLCEYVADTYPHIKQAITSNGSTIVMMRPEKVKRLFHDVDISLDFPDEKKHCRFRNHGRAWEWVMDALDVLKTQDIQGSLVTCVNSQTTNQDIESLLNIAREYDVNWRINWFRCTGRGTHELRISAERAWEIIKFLSDKASFYCIDSIFAGPLRVKSSECPAGQFSCRIHENMDTSCYPFLKGKQWSGGNLLDPNVNMNTIYNSLEFKRVRERHIPYCENCAFNATCKGGCVTRAFLHNGGINQPDDYCPVLAGITDEYIQEINLEFEDQCDLVHDGYLCTTIVKPK